MTPSDSELRGASRVSRADTPTVGVSRPKAGPEESPGIGRGACLGRYVVLYALGAGGMGKVFAAYDPELDRKVALKVLRGDLRRSYGAKAEQRLLREAQAIARLAHPNVVTAYDVGAVEGRIFIAMELIEGMTLDRWLEAEPRSSQEILRVFVEAGRGLAAAHRMGLVHRDFKPRNVMVSEDGRARILDFGLVSAIPVELPELFAEPEKSGGGSWPGPAGDRLGRTLTRTGGRLGTPAYMAPEQAAGRRADHRTDQFSFCVSLYQAFCGELPSLQGGVDDSRLARRRRGNAGGAALPGWLWRPLQRGLAADPEARFPSMEDLLAEIGRDPARRRRGSLAALAFLVAGVALAGATWRPGEPQALCQGAERKLEGIWDDAARAESRRAFDSTGATFAGESWTRAAALLDDYAGAWVAAHREACEATRLRGEQSERLLDLRMACLDGRLQELRAVSGLFRNADAYLVLRAGEVADGLAGLGECGDRRRLTAAVGVAMPADATVAARVERERARLAESRIQELAGRYERASESAEAAHRAAETLGYLPLLAETLHRLASSRGRLGRLAEFRDGMVQAVRVGQAAGHDHVVAEALTDLVVSGVVRGDAGEAHLWAELAAGAVERLGSEGDLASRLRFFRGMLADLEARFPEAIAYYQEALEVDSEITTRDRWRTLNNLGVAYSRLGQHREALASYRVAVAAIEAVHGSRAPTLMGPLYNLGNLHVKAGDFAAALPFFERALGIAEQAGLPDLLEVPVNLLGLGEALVGAGRPLDAIAPLERAIAVGEARPQDRAYTAQARFHLARALVMTGGDRDLAHRHALAARETLRATGDRWLEELRQIDAWLAERPRGSAR